MNSGHQNYYVGLLISYYPLGYNTLLGDVVFKPYI